MAGTAVSISSYDAMLKIFYVDKKNLYKMDAGHNKLLGTVPKDPTGGGASWRQPVQSVGIVGDSATYASGSANYTSGEDYVFAGSWKYRYALGALEDSVIRLSRTDKDAFAAATKNKVESVRDQVAESTNLQLFRTEGGYVSKVGSFVTPVANGTTGTLASGYESDARFIKRGMRMFLATTDGGNPGSGGEILIDTVNIAAGTFTVAPASSVFCTGTFIHKAGDKNLSLSGLESWVPRTDALAATTFKTVDRSVDITRLAGNRVNGSGISVKEALTNGISAARASGGNPKVAFLGPTQFQALVNDLNGNITYNSVPGMDYFKRGRTAGVGFESLSFACGGTPVEVIEETGCQGNLSWILDWGEGTSGRKIRFTYTPDGWPYNRGKGTDGLEMLRAAGTSYVFELFCIGELICAAPGHQAVVTF